MTKYTVRGTEAGDIIIPGNWSRLVAALNNHDKLKEKFFDMLSNFLARNLTAEETTRDDIISMTDREFDIWRDNNCK